MADQRKNCMRQWFDLPPELLSSIAESLDLIRLLAFRGVCKTWNSASSTASALSSAKPWFLLYGENNSECQLLSESNEKYTLSVPELFGATCIASGQGWLLVFQESSGSVFFFCPFSNAKIDLPDFPASQLSDHIAAFSSPPTSQDCIVCVIGRTSNDEWELNILRHGAKEWTKHNNYSCKRNKINAIKGAAYDKNDGEFYFFDQDNKVITLPTENLCWHYYIIVSPGTAYTKALPFKYCKDYFLQEKLKEKLELAGKVSLSTCGTQIQTGGQLIFSESITDDVAEDQSDRRQLKGVWIHPRLHQISSIEQNW